MGTNKTPKTKKKKLSAELFNGEVYIVVPPEVTELHIFRGNEIPYSQEIRITLTK